ncbi:MAG: M20/M25/M40 family metallo-hydrolase [Synergistaceae bacterium]|jgi:LysW-gamma-L-lysine carboxypeptidase|nr:M20/M25/M40 family metallo-hydrolase [Synergistaceae bacterium]
MSETILPFTLEAARELLVRLVEIPSVTGGEDEACEYLAGALSSFGWERAGRDEAGNVTASRGSGEREILLLGHIDTVPGGPLCRVEGDVLWGRGSVDAKGPLAAFVLAGGAVAPPIPVALSDEWKITLVAAVGEEGDSRGARYVIPRRDPTACVVGEPSGTEGITVGYRGYLRLRLSARDGGAHRSGDAGPVTACLLAAADVLGQVERSENSSKPVIERPSGAVIAMWGQEEGERAGLVDIDVRLPLGADPGAWARELSGSAEKRGVHVEVVSSMPAHLVKKDDPLVRALRVAVRDAGLTPRLLAKGGTADFNLAAAWDCPMAAYGPGDSKLDHTSEERVDLNEYLKAAFILKNALENFIIAYDSRLEGRGYPLRACL